MVDRIDYFVNLVVMIVTQYHYPLTSFASHVVYGMWPCPWWLKYAIHLHHHLQNFRIDILCYDGNDYGHLREMDLLHDLVHYHAAADRPPRQEVHCYLKSH